MALSWAAATVSGSNWDAHKGDGTPGAVLYWATEGQHGLWDRLASWQYHHGVQIDPRRFLVPRLSPTLDNDGVGQALIDHAAGAEARLVIIDTLSRAKGHSLKEKDSDDMNYLMGFFDVIARLPAAPAVLYVHHTGWSDTSRERGSSALMDSASQRYRVHRSGMRTTVFHEKNKEGEEAPPAHFRLETVQGSKVLVPDSQVLVPDGITKQVLDFLEEDGNWVTTKELTNWTKAPRQRIGEAAQELLSAQLIDVASDGPGRSRRYRIRTLNRPPDGYPTQATLNTNRPQPSARTLSREKAQ